MKLPNSATRCHTSKTEGDVVETNALSLFTIYICYSVEVVLVCRTQFLLSCLDLNKMDHPNFCVHKKAIKMCYSIINWPNTSLRSYKSSRAVQENSNRYQNTSKTPLNPFIIGEIEILKHVIFCFLLLI